MYTLERWLDDAARQRGSLSKTLSGVAGYQACWDAFNRYISAVLGKKQTLSMSNFCKIGWRIEESAQGKVKLRPHFHISDAFARAYGLDAKGLGVVSDKALTAVEEFNFSKAAIRFSQNLSKENLFMGMRALLGLLGEAMASGQAVCVELEVGRLRCSERVLSFEFGAEMYLSEGLEVPRGASTRSDYKPSATFRPPTADGQTLSLQGRREGEVKSHSAFLGGWEEPQPHSARYRGDGGATEAGGARSEASATPGASASMLSRSEVVANDHFHRHLARIEEEAAQAVVEKQQFEEHLKRLHDEENSDHQYRKALAKDYAEQLERQIHEAERRRAQGRQFVIEQASQHDFPDFSVSPDQALFDKMNERQKHFKEDLDQQVELKRRAKQAAKQQTREQEASSMEAMRRELAQRKLEASVKKEMERAMLHQAWDKDKRLHSLRKTIDEHHRTPASRAALSNPGASPQMTPRLELGSMASPRADFDTMSQASSRPMTGSVRRVPFGAAASLALHKERLGQTARR